MADPINDMAGGDRPAEPFVTLAEASAATGRPAEAIRAMIRRGRLKSLKGNDGRTLVAIPAAMRVEPGQPSAGRPADHVAADPGRVAGHPAAENGRLAAAWEAAEEWRAAAEESRLAAAVADVRLAEASRTHAAELAAMREQLEAGVAARNAVIEEMRAELARLRRPWWRRLTG